MTQLLNLTPSLSKKINLQDYEPLKIGLHYFPPMIMIEYIVPSTDLIRILQDKFFESIENKETQTNQTKEKNLEQSQRLVQSVINDNPLQTNFNNLHQINQDTNISTPQFNSQAQQKKQQERVDYQQYDLNKLTTEELNKEKSKMDELFLKNQKRPGEEGFVYDIQVDYVPYEANEWDEDDEK